MPARVPSVALAVLCEHAIENADGTLTLVRILDEITVASSDQRAFPAVVPVTAVVAVRFDEAPTHGTLTLLARDPSGATTEVAIFSVDMADRSRSLARTIPLKIAVERAGEYAFDVQFDGQLLSRMRLAVHAASAH